jgi:hypothetical protein
MGVSGKRLRVGGTGYRVRGAEYGAPGAGPGVLRGTGFGVRSLVMGLRF